MAHIKKINEMSGGQETTPVNEWFNLPDFTWTTKNHKNLKYRLMSIMNYFYGTPFHGISKKGYKLEKTIVWHDDVESLSNLPLFNDSSVVELIAYSNDSTKLDVRFNLNNGKKKIVPFDEFDEDTQIKIYDELIRSWKRCTETIFRYYNEL